MRLFEEYGAKLTAGQDSSNSESIPNLSQRIRRAAEGTD
ncbi:DUF3102 domain-containing protein [Desulfosporosinus hippei]|nr:DUF3102 domain-containing protein [Desulfosporosinus hippei]